MKTILKLFDIIYNIQNERPKFYREKNIEHIIDQTLTMVLN